MHTKHQDTRRLFMRTALGAAFALSQLAAASSALAQARPLPDFRFELLTGEDQDSRAVDINNRGAVVGTIAAPTQYWGQETLWPRTGAPVSLQGFGGQVTSVNNAGRAAGFQQIPGQDIPVTWWQGQLQPLPLDGYPHGYALGISDSGTVVGSLVTPQMDTVPAKWAHGKAQPLPVPAGATGRALDVNDWGQIVGEVNLGRAGENHAYVWMRHRAVDLHPAGYTTSTGWAINSSGQVAGWAAKGSYSHAVVWTGRCLTDLNGNAERSLAYDINDAGQVVGDASMTPDRVNTAVLWDSRYGKEAINLNRYVPADLAQAGWHLMWAKAINNAGVIVGDAFQASTQRTRAFKLTPVHAQ